MTAPTDACLFGTYEAGHSANRLLRLALTGAGWRVTECHERLWEETRNKGRRYFGVTSLARLGLRWASAAGRLRRRWRASTAAPPLVVVGFGGQLDVLFAGRFCRPRAALVFAPLVSLTETLVEDRRIVRGLGARALAALDRASLRAADLVLADTAAHTEYLAGLAPRAPLATWYLGVEPEFLPPVVARPLPRRVLFYGRHLPLHGVETIVAAAARLGERAEFVLIGDGPGRAAAETLAQRAGARITWREEVPLARLPAELGAAAVVLGAFGAGRKAEMVVPNKVWQAAAAGRPLVTRDGPALREVLRPGEHCLACPPGDPVALADAIARLLENPGLAEGLGRAARAHVLARFGPERQAAHLAALLFERLGVGAPPALAPRAAGG